MTLILIYTASHNFVKLKYNSLNFLKCWINNWASSIWWLLRNTLGMSISGVEEFGIHLPTIRIFSLVHWFFYMPKAKKNFEQAIDWYYGNISLDGWETHFPLKSFTASAYIILDAKIWLYVASCEIRNRTERVVVSQDLLWHRDYFWTDNARQVFSHRRGVEKDQQHLALSVPALLLHIR